MNALLLSALCLLGAALAGGVTVQDGNFSFSLESVKKLKGLQESQEPRVGKFRKFGFTPGAPVVSILCSNPNFPEELKPLCKEPNAQEMLQRLGAGSLIQHGEKSSDAGGRLSQVQVLVLQLCGLGAEVFFGIDPSSPGPFPLVLRVCFPEDGAV
ncbi:guanylin isoform X1 [Callithrix jacchus]